MRTMGVYSGGHRADWLPLDLKRAAAVQENHFYGGVPGSTAGTGTLHSGRRRGHSWKTPGERVGPMPGEGTRTPARVWGAVKVPAPQLRVLPCRFSKNRRGATLCLLILLTLMRPVSCGAPEQKDLQRDRLSAPYRACLLRGASDFYSFCKRNDCSPERLGQSAAVTSDMLVKYVQHLYDNRKPYWVAKHAVLAMQTVYRQHKGHLRPAWDSIQTWRLEKPVLSRTPMRPEFLHAICSYGVLAATFLDRKRSLLWWAFIVCLKVGFHGLLRPKEWFCLKSSEIRLPVKRGFFESRVCVVSVLDPENKAVKGRVQVRLIRAEGALAWLLWYVPHLPQEARLWPSSPRTFRNMPDEALRFLSLENCKFTPGSLRAGGATHRLETGVSPQISNSKGLGPRTKVCGVICRRQRPPQHCSA